MKKRLMVFAAAGCIAVLAIGCSKNASYLDRMKLIEKQTCACADTVCAEKAFNDFLSFAREIRTQGIKFKDEDNRKLGRHTAAIIRCVMMKGVSPVTIQGEIQKLKK